MTPEQERRLKRQLILRLAVFVGFKVAVAFVLHRWSKDIAQRFEEEMDEDLEWFVDPIAVKKLDGSLGRLLRIGPA